MPSLLKLAKEGPRTIIYQVDKETLNDVLEENKELKEILDEKMEEKDIELESIRYCLWLDPDRCCAFFADSVLICEGLSEKALTDTLIKEGKIQFRNSKTYILNSGGKYDIHRYMNLFGKLGIRHSILFDGDNNSEKHRRINDFIQKNRNSFTVKHHQFLADFEDFLGISKESDRYKKPLNVMWHYRNKKISQDKIGELAKIVRDLMG